MGGSLVEKVRSVSDWFTSNGESGDIRYQAGRILAVLLFLEERGCDISGCSLVVSPDRSWSKRRSRTAIERKARLIGGSKAKGKTGLTAEFLFIVPPMPNMGSARKE